MPKPTKNKIKANGKAVLVKCGKCGVAYYIDENKIAELNFCPYCESMVHLIQATKIG